LENPVAMKTHLFYRSTIFRIGIAVAKILPRRVFREGAAGIGWCYNLLNGHYRRVVARNLSHIFPNDPARVRQLTRRTFQNFARSLADYCVLADKQSDPLAAMGVELSGLENLDAALQRGHGVIVATLHLGNWELGGLTFASKGYPLRVVTQEEPTPELTAQREKYRAVHHIKTIKLGHTQFSFLEAMGALRENHLLAMLVDRPYAASALEVNFFGAPMLFSPAPVALALATGATILPAYVVLGSDGRHYARIEPPVVLQEHEEAKESLRINTQTLASGFEPVVRQYPDQWFHFVPLWK
jgi:KDO2-lipid IV(A) lauroyltransferase